MLGFWRMVEWSNRREIRARRGLGRDRAIRLLATGLLLLSAGCASPGRPLPPSLEVPRVVNDLTASRVGDEVHLRWTTPGRTTDGVAIQGVVRAEICRSTVAGVPDRGGVCAVSGESAVRSGASEASDLLTGELAAGDPRLVAYRVQLRGATGKTAGPGAPVYVAAGAAPEPVLGLKASDSKAGAVLEWTPGALRPQETVELERVSGGSPAASPAQGRPAGRQAQGLGGLFGKGTAGAKEPATALVRLSAGERDEGGVVDRTAEVGRTYRYAAQRVRVVTLGGTSLEVRSVLSAPVTVVMRDVYPPEAPVGLVAAPGPGSIDLSWEPGVEPAGATGGGRLVSYRVYRQDASGGEWRLITSGPLATPAYRDSSVQAGQRYRYRVTAVDGEGHESAPSGEVLEGLEP